jgi:hypothetical protein
VPSTVLSFSDAFIPQTGGTQMPLGTLSIRGDDSYLRHHLYRNGNLWWTHFTVHHSGFKKKRIRRSLGTALLEEAIRKRDELLHQIARDGLIFTERKGGTQ